MDIKSYAIEYYLCILEIELMHKKNVKSPESVPEWLGNLVDYLLSEYANSKEGLYFLGKALSVATSYSDLKGQLINAQLAEFEEANEKLLWK